MSFGFPDVVIVAAMVAYQDDDWSLAREFGERALERLRKALARMSSIEPEGAARYKDNMRELEYLFALCQRLELCNITGEHPPTDQDPEILRQRFKSAERVNQNALLDCEERFDLFRGRPRQCRARNALSRRHGDSTACIRRSSWLAGPTTPCLSRMAVEHFVARAVISTSLFSGRYQHVRAVAKQTHPVWRKTFTSKPTSID